MPAITCSRRAPFRIAGRCMKRRSTAAWARSPVLRYSRASKETGIGKGEYARVVGIDAGQNRIAVALKDGREVSYDPHRQQGVSVYREEERAFSTGDRIQFTAPANDLKVANRELGTVESIAEGRMSLRMDDGRAVELDPARHPHLDQGYAVTSHSSQGQTAERVLIHVDTELGAKDLLNNRMAYVAVSRGAHDAQLFTDDREKLPKTLGHEVSRESPHAPAQSGADDSAAAAGDRTQDRAQLRNGTRSLSMTAEKHSVGGSVSPYSRCEAAWFHSGRHGADEQTGWSLN